MSGLIYSTNGNMKINFVSPVFHLSPSHMEFGNDSWFICKNSTDSWSINIRSS